MLEPGPRPEGPHTVEPCAHPRAPEPDGPNELGRHVSAPGPHERGGGLSGGGRGIREVKLPDRIGREDQRGVEGEPASRGRLRYTGSHDRAGIGEHPDAARADAFTGPLGRAEAPLRNLPQLGVRERKRSGRSVPEPYETEEQGARLDGREDYVHEIE